MTPRIRFVQRDPNRCINCGRCVRVCKYITGSGVYEFAYRGADTIATPLDSSLNDTDLCFLRPLRQYLPDRASSSGKGA